MINKLHIKNTINRIIYNNNTINNNKYYNITNYYLDNMYNGLGNDHTHIHDIDTWINKIYTFNSNKLINTYILDKLVSHLLIKLFNNNTTNNINKLYSKNYISFISKPIFNHTTNGVIITFNRYTNIINNNNNNTNNDSNYNNNKYSYKYNIINDMIIAPLFNTLGIYNINNKNSLIYLLSKYYNKKVAINITNIKDIKHNNSLFINALNHYLINNSNNNNAIGKDIHSKLLGNNIYNNKVTINNIKHVKSYYTTIYNNIYGINDTININITNVLNNTNISYMDNTMPNKYISGHSILINGKGSNVAAIARTKKSKYSKGTLVNYSSKSYIHNINNIYNDNNRNVFIKLRNKAIFNNINNNTINNNTHIK